MNKHTLIHCIKCSWVVILAVLLSIVSAIKPAIIKSLIYFTFLLLLFVLFFPIDDLTLLSMNDIQRIVQVIFILAIVFAYLIEFHASYLSMDVEYELKTLSKKYDDKVLENINVITSEK